jgi:hypothetical protein
MPQNVPSFPIVTPLALDCTPISDTSHNVDPLLDPPIHESVESDIWSGLAFLPNGDINFLNWDVTYLFDGTV